MLTADARQQGGHPTCSDHTFTSEATVEDGEVTLFRRTGQYPYEFCPAGYRIVDNILSRGGTPPDGFYTFSIKRDHSAKLTFKDPNDEYHESTYVVPAQEFEAEVARRDIKWLDKGMERVQQLDIVEMAQVIVYTIFKQLTRHESFDERFPTWQEYQFLAHTTISVHYLQVSLRSNPRVRAYMIGREFIMVLNGTQVHIAYAGHYQMWGLVYAQQMVNWLREGFEDAFRKEALRFLGHNLAMIQQARAMNAHFRVIIGEEAEDEITKATEQAQAQHLNREQQQREPVHRDRLELDRLFHEALSLLDSEDLFMTTRQAGEDALRDFVFIDGPDLHSFR
jgi:hypothetical protein